MFNYSNIYYFRYTPKGIGKLPIWDQFPLMIPLDIRGPFCLGLNIHWIPVPLRLKFISLVNAMLEKSINKNMFRLWYQTIKSQPPLTFSLMAIRKYYISRCSGVQLIPNTEWENLSLSWNLRYKARFMRQVNQNYYSNLKWVEMMNRPKTKSTLTQTQPTQPSF